jgi:hypothetical protein
MIAFVSFFSLSAMAYVTTADRVDYLVTLQSFTSPGVLNTCVKHICSLSSTHGNGTCTYLQNVGVVTVNLDSYAANQVSKLGCVYAIESSGVVEAKPSVGRSN